MGYKLTNHFVKNPLNSQMANMEQFVQICQDKLGFKIKFKLDRINIRYFGIIRVENRRLAKRNMNMKYSVIIIAEHEFPTFFFLNFI